MPEVTVLTATYNGEHCLAETVAGFLAQSFRDFEYIIVDDGSVDGTPKLLAKLQELDSRIRVIRRDFPGGPYVAGNTGLREARGRFIVISDHDDISLPRRIETQVDFLKSRGNLKACTTNVRILGDSGIELRLWQPVPASSSVLRWALCLRPFLTHSSLCIERETLEEVGGYCERSTTNEDYRLFCTLTRLGLLEVVPEFHVHFRVHARSVTASRVAECASNDAEVVREHLQELTGQPWQQAEVGALPMSGARISSLNRALTALRRWDQAWMSDLSLNPSDVLELRNLSIQRRSRLFHMKFRSQPFAVLRNIKDYMAPAP